MDSKAALELELTEEMRLRGMVDAAGDDDFALLQVLEDMQQEIDSRRWAAGYLFAKIHPPDGGRAYGERRMLVLAAAAGVSEMSARTWRQTYLAFPEPGTRMAGLTYTHHAKCARFYVPSEMSRREWEELSATWLKRAFDGAWSAERLEAEMRAFFGAPPKDEAHAAGVEKSVAKNVTDEETAAFWLAAFLKRLRDLNVDEDRVFQAARQMLGRMKREEFWDEGE